MIIIYENPLYVDVHLHEPFKGFSRITLFLLRASHPSQRDIEEIIANPHSQPITGWLSTMLPAWPRNVELPITNS